MYYGLGGFLMVASLIIALKGFQTLFKFKEYWLILGHLAFIIGFPILFMKYSTEFLWKIDEELRLWLFIPIGLVIPAWCMWGFIVNKTAKNVDEKETEI